MHPTKRPARKSTKKVAPPQSTLETLKDAPKVAEAKVKALIESGKPAFERAQAMVNETGKNLGRSLEGAVKTTLASLNIPTRSEINLLAKRVEELSRKIDSLKRR